MPRHNSLDNPRRNVQIRSSAFYTTIPPYEYIPMPKKPAKYVRQPITDVLFLLACTSNA